MAILIATFVLSCQSNNNSASASMKKYSEYTDLEKMNLKGDVIGLKDYDGRFYFFNENGMIEKLFSDDSYWEIYDYSDNRLLNTFSFISGDNCFVNNLEYNSGFLVTKTIFNLNDQETRAVYKYKNDINGFPIEESMFIPALNKEYITKFYRNYFSIDSSVHYNNGEGLSGKTIYKYKDDRQIESLFFDKLGEIDKENSYNYSYNIDSKGNDFKRKSVNLLSEVDSVERVVIYKGDDITKYSNMYSFIFSNMFKKGSTRNSDNNLEYDNNNSSNDFQEQPQQNEKIMCSRCGGTGQKICDNCYGKGETRCYRCDGYGIASDGRKCIYCNAGYEKCTRCYGKTRLSCDGCASRGYTNY
jgi:hypothetical protein